MCNLLLSPPHVDISDSDIVGALLWIDTVSDIFSLSNSDDDDEYFSLLSLSSE